MTRKTFCCQSLLDLTAKNSVPNAGYLYIDSSLLQYVQYKGFSRKREHIFWVPTRASFGLIGPFCS